MVKKQSKGVDIMKTSVFKIVLIDGREFTARKIEVDEVVSQAVKGERDGLLVVFDDSLARAMVGLVNIATVVLADGRRVYIRKGTDRKSPDGFVVGYRGRPFAVFGVILPLFVKAKATPEDAETASEDSVPIFITDLCDGSQQVVPFKELTLLSIPAK